MKKIIFLAGLIGLVACTRQGAQLQFNQQGLKKLTGQPVSAVYQKLGKPEKIFHKYEKTYLVYSTTYQNYTMPVSQTYNNPGMQIENGEPGEMGFYSPAECQTIFETVSDIVQDVSTTGICL